MNQRLEFRKDLTMENNSLKDSFNNRILLYQVCNKKIL